MKAVEFSLLLSLVASLPVLAKDGNNEAVQLDASNSDLLTQVQRIEQIIQTPQYVEMSEADSSLLKSLLVALQQDSMDTTVDSETQNRINSILKQAFADSRLVCTIEKAPNSNMKKRYCITVGAKKKESQKALNTSAVNKPVMVPNN